MEPDRADEAAQQVEWARYIARIADLGGNGRSDVHGEQYMSMTAGELADLADRHPGHPASRQIEKHLALAAEAARGPGRRGGMSGI